MENKNLQNMLEKILFDEKYLEQLKISINKVASGRLSPKEVRKLVIKHKTKCFEDVLELFPYYLNQVNNNHSLKEYTGELNRENDPEILNELEEKTSILEQIKVRVNNICKKLKLDT